MTAGLSPCPTVSQSSSAHIGLLLWKGRTRREESTSRRYSEASARVSSPPRPFVFIGLHTGCEIGMLVNMKNERLFSKRLDCRELSFHPSIIPTLLLGAAAL